MTAKTKEEIAAIIKPSIIAAMEADEDNNAFYSTYDCLTGRTHYEVTQRCEEDRDEDKPHAYRVDLSGSRAPAYSLPANDFSAAQDIIANCVADSLIQAKLDLLNACEKLGLSQAA
jgi:polynucleotide 5'-kinase involved in rRNA processing